MPPRPPLTHFLCLPLVTSISRPQLQSSLSRFAADVSKPGRNGEALVPPRAVRPLGALHFTIGMMSLQTPDQIERACRFLEKLDVRELLRTATIDYFYDGSAFKPGAPPDESRDLHKEPSPALLTKAEPLVVALTNLSSMQSPSSTSNLYASPDPLYPILPFAQSLHDEFLSAGLLLPPPKNRPLQLHATLVNTVYVKKSVGGKNRWGKGSEKIDAREMIETWGKTIWAEGVRVEKVAICEMGAKKIEDEGGNVVDEIYKEIASVDLP